MGDAIEYCGKSRAYLSTVAVPESREKTNRVMKWLITFDTLGDLELLLSLKPNDTVTVDGKSETYSDFKREILLNTHRIYTSQDSRFFDQVLHS